jgi:pimeloyl-ACP methyl ester carboxylesterase
MSHESLTPATAVARANGIEIAYEAFGREDAPPLLLIMGLGFQMVVWDEAFCRQLARRGYRVIRFDNRDVGLSTKLDGAGFPNISRLMEAMARGERPEVPYTLKDMAGDTIGLMDALGVGAAHVVGLSMGGMIAQVMALEYPARLRTLTSLMSSTGDPALPPPTPEALRVLMTPLPTEREAYVRASVQAWGVIGGDRYPVGVDLARKWAEASHSRGLSLAGIARQLAAVMLAGSRKEALGTVTVPTLVRHGDADPLVPVACGRATAEAIPGAKLHIIQGMGHALPQALWPEIIEAITRHATEREVSDGEKLTGIKRSTY